jgi:hypothetical protein
MSHQRRYSDPIMEHLHIKDKALNNSLRDHITKYLNQQQLEMVSTLLVSYNIRDERNERDKVGRLLLKKLNKLEDGVRSSSFPEIFDSFQRKLDDLDIKKRTQFDPEQLARDADVSLDYSQTQIDYEGPNISLSDPDTKRAFNLLREPTPKSFYQD